MRDPREDVLNKMDALLKKHHATEPDIPVLTDIVEHPRLDLEAIPVLTEEVELAAEAYQAPPIAPAPAVAPMEPSPAQQVAPVEEQVQAPLPEIAIDLVHPSVAEATPASDTNSVLQRLEAVEAEVQAEIDARIGKTQSAPKQRASIEVPPDARFISLAAIIPEPAASVNTPLATPSALTLAPPVASSAAAQLPEDLVKQVAAMIEADVGRIIKKQLHQSLDEELSGMLNHALDKALSSMLEQFMVHLEEVVRIAIADELKKQLAPFRRPAPTNKP